MGILFNYYYYYYLRKKNQVPTLVRAKQLIIYCQFLYTCFAFSCLLLRFYVCFSVIGQFWKEIEEMSYNGSKIGRFGNNLRSKAILSRLVDQGQSTVLDRGSMLATGVAVPPIEKVLVFSFFGFANIGQLGRQCPNLLGYLRTSKTHPQGNQNHYNSKIKERIKRRRSSCSQDLEFLHYFCNSLLVSSSTFFLVSF